MSKGKKLRELIARPEILLLPGAYDALSARIAALQGFEALGCGGNAATASLLAEPDMGQLGLRDYADHYARVAQAVDIPVLADADTGFGGVHNVRRAVREFERAGLAGLFFEDQTTPKRCGYLAGKSVVPAEEMIGKIEAALDARHDPSFVVGARSDAFAIWGLEAAIERGRLYREAGADLIFLQGLDRLEDLARACREVPGPHLANLSQVSGRTNQPTIGELQAAGAAAVIFPTAALLAAAQSVTRVMAALKRDGSLNSLGDLMPISDFYALTGLASFQEREDKCAETAKQISTSRLNAS